MKCHQFQGWLLFIFALSFQGHAAEMNPAPPRLTGVSVSNGQQRVTWTPYPATEAFRLLSTSNLSQPLAPNNGGTISGYEWTGPLNGGADFHRVEVTPLSSNA